MLSSERKYHTTLKGVMSLFKRSKKSRKTRSPNKNYKIESELTDNDYKMIDADRLNTGIQYYSDEYYYNNILYHNYNKSD